GLGLAPAGDVEETVDREVALAGGRGADGVGFVGEADVERVAVGLGEDGDGGEPGLAARPDEADRDLAAVGDEDLTEHAPRAVGRLGGGAWCRRRPGGRPAARVPIAHGSPGPGRSTESRTRPTPASPTRARRSPRSSSRSPAGSCRAPPGWGWSPPSARASARWRSRPPAPWARTAPASCTRRGSHRRVAPGGRCRILRPERRSGGRARRPG